MKQNSKWTKQAKRWFKVLLQEYNFESEELFLVHSLCNQLSIYYQASEQLEKEGLFFSSENGVIKKHPGTEVCKHAFAGVIAMCKLLKIGSPPDEIKNRPGRPNGIA